MRPRYTNNFDILNEHWIWAFRAHTTENSNIPNNPNTDWEVIGMEQKAQHDKSFILVKQYLLGSWKTCRYILFCMWSWVYYSSIYVFEAIWLKKIYNKLDHPKENPRWYNNNLTISLQRIQVIVGEASTSIVDSIFLEITQNRKQYHLIIVVIGSKWTIYSPNVCYRIIS